jgi:hypothetical protein
MRRVYLYIRIQIQASYILNCRHHGTPSSGSDRCLCHPLEIPVILTPIPDKLTPYVRSFVSGM